MPTGYTAGVGDGTVTTFQEYATQCMRAFGATILMRDDPSDAPIKDFVPSDYHKTALEKAEKQQSAFLLPGDEEIQQKLNSDFRERTESWKERTANYAAIRVRYETMLEKAKKFVPKTIEHEEFGKFLVKQLEESIAFDCHDISEDKPKVIDVESWKTAHLASLKWDIDYHRKHYAEEIERTNSRNSWIKNAREAIAEMQD